LWVFLYKGTFPPIWEEEKALNLVEVITDKLTIEIRICNFKVSGFTCVKMALMLLGTMVLGEGLREEENKN